MMPDLRKRDDSLPIFPDKEATACYKFLNLYLRECTHDSTIHISRLQATAIAATLKHAVLIDALPYG